MAKTKQQAKKAPKVKAKHTTKAKSTLKATPKAKSPTKTTSKPKVRSTTSAKKPAALKKTAKKTVKPTASHQTKRATAPAAANKKIAKKIETHRQTKASTHAYKTTTTQKKTFHLSDAEKAVLLETITKIINLHRSDKDGLKSLTQIERILDQYNQKYVASGDKFDAIIKYGIDKDPAVIHEHQFMLVNGKDKETIEFYKLLAGFGLGKIKFAEIKNKMEQLYDEAWQSRHA